MTTCREDGVSSTNPRPSRPSSRRHRRTTGSMPPSKSGGGGGGGAAGRIRPRSAKTNSLLPNNSEHVSSSSSVIIPAARPSLDTMAEPATATHAGGYNNRWRTAIFAMLLVSSILYNDTPIQSLQNVLLLATTTKDGNFRSSPSSSSGDSTSPAAPAFSTSHGREITMFGGGGSGSGADGAIGNSRGTAGSSSDADDAISKFGTAHQHHHPHHTAITQRGHRQVRRRNGPVRRPKLAHARDAAAGMVAYGNKIPEQQLQKNDDGASELEGQRTVVRGEQQPQTAKQQALRGLHPRERVLSRANIGGVDGGSAEVLPLVSSSTDVGAATKSTKPRTRFVLEDLPSVLEGGEQLIDPYNSAQLHVSAHSGRGSVAMTVLGIVVGLGAALSLGVLLFMADGGRSGLKRRRAAQPGSISSSTSSSAPVLLESIEEDLVEDGTRRRRQRSPDSLSL